MTTKSLIKDQTGNKQRGENMKGFFSLLTFGFILMGFFFPIAWGGAVITGIIAIGSSPSGKRADGKSRTGGLLGGLVDNAVVSSKMRECPYCGNQIFRKAVKCQYCHEKVEAIQEGIFTKDLFGKK